MENINVELNTTTDDNRKRKRKSKTIKSSTINKTKSIDSKNAEKSIQNTQFIKCNPFLTPTLVAEKDITIDPNFNDKANFNINLSSNITTDYEEPVYNVQETEGCVKQSYPIDCFTNNQRQFGIDDELLDITDLENESLSNACYKIRKKSRSSDSTIRYNTIRSSSCRSVSNHISEAVTFFALKKTILLMNEVANYSPDDGTSKWNEILELLDDAQRYIDDAVLANFKNEDLSCYQLQLPNLCKNSSNRMNRDVDTRDYDIVSLSTVNDVSLIYDKAPRRVEDRGEDYLVNAPNSILGISTTTIDEGYNDYYRKREEVTERGDGRRSDEGGAVVNERSKVRKNEGSDGRRRSNVNEGSEGKRSNVNEGSEGKGTSFEVGTSSLDEDLSITKLDDVLAEKRNLYMDMINSNKISGIDLRIPSEILHSVNSHLFEKTFEFSQRLDELNKNVFGYDGFRGVQLAAINAIMLGRDCFLMMATGGGKSHCYQLPSLLLNGLVVVFSPLISLMEDQILTIRSYGIKAETLNSKSTAKDIRDLSKRLLGPFEKFENGYILFITPEKFDKSPSVLKLLNSVNELNRLKLFVIDEAHCVSQWGLSFRRDYRKLSNLKIHFPRVPILAMTATATPEVMNDIIAVLHLKNYVTLRTTINRPNLWIEVREKTKNYVDEIISILNATTGCAIIYCLTTTDCEKMAVKLIESGISATVYHARLHIDERTMAQKKWKDGSIRVMVATIAFGMGIDKADVRFVFHSSAPTSILGYYQEIGRAGRDGKFSTTILWYSYKDFERHKTLSTTTSRNGSPSQNSIKSAFSTMREYCQNRTICRRVMLLHAFGEVLDDEYAQCLGCDNCSIQSSSKVIDTTDEAVSILMLVNDTMKYRHKAILTLNILCDALRGSNRSLVVKYQLNESPFHGKLRHLNQKFIFQIINEMIALKILKECKRTSMGFTRTVIIEGPNANKLIKGDINVKIVSYDEDPSNISSRISDEKSQDTDGKDCIMIDNNHDDLLAIPPDVTSTLGLSTSLPLGVEPSSNYLPVNGNATPGDRGEVSHWTSSGKPESDLRELEGEVNREAPCNGKITTSGGMASGRGGVGTGPQVEPAADLREAKGEVNRRGTTPSGRLQKESSLQDDLRWNNEYKSTFEDGLCNGVQDLTKKDEFPQDIILKKEDDKSQVISQNDIKTAKKII